MRTAEQSVEPRHENARENSRVDGQSRVWSERETHLPVAGGRHVQASIRALAPLQKGRDGQRDADVLEPERPAGLGGVGRRAHVAHDLVGHLERRGQHLCMRVEDGYAGSDQTHLHHPPQAQAQHIEV